MLLNRPLKVHCIHLFSTLLCLPHLQEEVRLLRRPPLLVGLLDDHVHDDGLERVAGDAVQRVVGVTKDLNREGQWWIITRGEADRSSRGRFIFLIFFFSEFSKESLNSPNKHGP